MKRSLSVLAASAAVVLGLVVSAPAASAATGDLDLYLANPADRSESLEALDIGNILEGDVPLVCDIVDDADGAVPVIFNDGAWFSPGADGEVTFGRAGDVPLCGDFGVVDADEEEAADTFAVRRGNRYFISDQPARFNASGAAVRSFVFGRATDQALVGDWDGDGVDTIAVRRGSTIFYATANVDGGGEVRTSSYGRPLDIAVAGDFTGQGYDTVAVRRGSAFFVSQGRPGQLLSTSSSFQYGRASDVPVAGEPFRGENSFFGVVRIER
ncbi:hypothetical protein [Pseudokineococcus sp. 1T1Z-3]|uniref:hypothetical protein n=1 Tax=Pseudokineococcus sp. 1T1Z-3 TaxID=3132745 RepID=UPI0030A23640